MAHQDQLKRSFDIAAAGLALALLAIPLGILAVAVRVRIGAPVLFIQVRPGRHGQPFRLYKLRTMRDDTDQEGRLLPDEARLTHLGRFLRSTSLDELPELWNVLRGDMSLVGPRPLLMEYLPHYSATQSRRHEVRPGLTGLAQVEGRNDIAWEERLRLDVWYVDHRSMWLDFKIVIRTLMQVLKRSGVSHPGHATMPHFVRDAAAEASPPDSP